MNKKYIITIIQYCPNCLRFYASNYRYNDKCENCDWPLETKRVKTEVINEE